MKSSYILSALFCAALSAPLTAQAAVPQPNTGFYHAVSYITAATPSATCGAFGIAAGPGSAGSLYYPGPKATGAIFRYESTKSDAVVAQVFSTTPAAGATSWSGTVTEGNEPSPSFPIAFKAKLTYLDTQSFTGVFTLSVVVGANKCTVTENIAFSQTGS